MASHSDTILMRLKPGRDKALRQGHPWLYSGAVASYQGPPEAPLARVVAADGKPLGLGFHSPRSQIRARLLGHQLESVDEDFFQARLEEAFELRQAVVPGDTTGYRLLNAEGDGVPGWTVDRYGSVLVSQITVAGLEALRGPAYAALGQRFPEAAILQANDLAARKSEGLGKQDEVISGTVPAEVSFEESGLTFRADLEGGQKTGFYCDQRENRRLVERLSGGRSLLDLFAHSGAFGVYARRGGASRVTHVESSPRLELLAAHHHAVNDHAAPEPDWVRANVFEYLRAESGAYELVVCDPPPLVKKRADLQAGARAYKDLNRLALQRVAPRGFFLTFTCSAAVDGRLFRQILFSAAREAGVRLSLLAPLAAAADHPVAVTHPEGEYLKGWLCRVAGGLL
jgi:23S rRNA (cytosine1962-C5)-methyltransferase